VCTGTPPPLHRGQAHPIQTGILLPNNFFSDGFDLHLLRTPAIRIRLPTDLIDSYELAHPFANGEIAVYKAHRLLYDSTLGLIVIKRTKKVR